MHLIKPFSRTRILSMCTALALLTGATQAYATSDLEQGLDAQKHGNLPSAARHFAAASESGSSEAQYQLGLLYAQGHGVDINHSQAMILMQQAADAAYLLAIAWLAEQGEEEDPEDDC